MVRKGEDGKLIFSDFDLATIQRNVAIIRRGEKEIDNFKLFGVGVLLGLGFNLFSDYCFKTPQDSNILNTIHIGIIIFLLVILIIYALLYSKDIKDDIKFSERELDDFNKEIEDIKKNEGTTSNRLG